MTQILTALLGPDVRLHGSKMNMKDPQYGSPVEWHQDWAFYPHTNDDLLAIGVMLEDIDEENGALLVMPGTHRHGVYDHHAEGRLRCNGSGRVRPGFRGGVLPWKGRLVFVPPCAWCTVRPRIVPTGRARSCSTNALPPMPGRW